MEKNSLMVTAIPHIRSKVTISGTMLHVLIALVPATVMSVVFFGLEALWVILVSILSAVLFEFLYQKATKQKVTILDLSAVITGLLLAMNLPATVPLWLPVVGSFFAIVVVKQLFGGLGQNFMNPALAARVLLVTSFPKFMTDWSHIPRFTDAVTSASQADMVSTATPLVLLETNGIIPASKDLLDAFLGRVNGSLGETCAVALLVGGLYLIIRKVISWRIPVCFIGGVFVFSWIFGRSGFFSGYPLYEILTGGVMLGAIFMATDYSTSPVTPIGQIIMGLGCAFITVMIRVFGNYPEGVSFAILLMNLCVPLIEQITRPRVYGEVRKHA